MSNHKNYELVFDAVGQLSMNDVALAKLIHESMHHESLELNISGDSDRTTIYRFMWLMFVRNTEISPKKINQVFTYLGLIKAGLEKMDMMQKLLLETEQKYAIDDFDIQQIAIESMKQEIMKVILAVRFTG